MLILRHRNGCTPTQTSLRPAEPLARGSEPAERIARPHPLPRRVMIVQVMGFAGLSVKVGILAVFATEAKPLRSRAVVRGRVSWSWLPGAQQIGGPDAQHANAHLGRGPGPPKSAFKGSHVMAIEEVVYLPQGDDRIAFAVLE